MKNPTISWRAIALPVLILAATSALGGVVLAGVSSTTDEVASAATSFVATLDAEGRDRAMFPLGDAEQFNWHFVPRERNGLPLKAMTLAQRTAAHQLLKSALSSQGYLKANGIIELERVLGIMEGREERRDPEDYYFAIFGSPAADGAWAWRFEGHHISMSFSSAGDDNLITGPAFMGSNPHIVPSGPKAGLRVLASEEDLARELVTMLSSSQRGSAVIASEAYDDIISGAERTVDLAYEGIRARRSTRPSGPSSTGSSASTCTTWTMNPRAGGWSASRPDPTTNSTSRGRDRPRRAKATTTASTRPNSSSSTTTPRTTPTTCTRCGAICGTTSVETCCGRTTSRPRITITRRRTIIRTGNGSRISSARNGKTARRAKPAPPPRTHYR